MTIRLDRRREVEVETQPKRFTVKCLSCGWEEPRRGKARARLDATAHAIEYQHQVDVITWERVTVKPI